MTTLDTLRDSSVSVAVDMLRRGVPAAEVRDQLRRQQAGNGDTITVGQAEAWLDEALGLVQTGGVL